MGCRHNTDSESQKTHDVFSPYHGVQTDAGLHLAFNYPMNIAGSLTRVKRQHHEQILCTHKVISGVLTPLPQYIFMVCCWPHGQYFYVQILLLQDFQE